MKAAEQRKKKAIRLYQKGKSPAEIAKKLKVTVPTVRRYLKGRPVTLKEPPRAQLTKTKAPEGLKFEFQQCFALIFQEARRCLDELREDRELRPEARVKQIQVLMDSIAKATQTAKKLDPSLNLEVVIGELMTIVGEVLLAKAPALGEVFIAQTHEIERRILQQKDQWLP